MSINYLFLVLIGLGSYLLTNSVRTATGIFLIVFGVWFLFVHVANAFLKSGRR